MNFIIKILKLLGFLVLFALSFNLTFAQNPNYYIEDRNGNLVEPDPRAEIPLNVEWRVNFYCQGCSKAWGSEGCKSYSAAVQKMKRHLEYWCRSSELQAKACAGENNGTGCYCFPKIVASYPFDWKSRFEVIQALKLSFDKWKGDIKSAIIKFTAFRQSSLRPPGSVLKEYASVLSLIQNKQTELWNEHNKNENDGTMKSEIQSMLNETNSLQQQIEADKRSLESEIKIYEKTEAEKKVKEQEEEKVKHADKKKDEEEKAKLEQENEQKRIAEVKRIAAEKEAARIAAEQEAIRKQNAINANNQSNLRSELQAAQSLLSTTLAINGQLVNDKQLEFSEPSIPLSSVYQNNNSDQSNSRNITNNNIVSTSFDEIGSTNMEDETSTSISIRHKSPAPIYKVIDKHNSNCRELWFTTTKIEIELGSLKSIQIAFNNRFGDIDWTNSNNTSTYQLLTECLPAQLYADKNIIDVIMTSTDLPNTKILLDKKVEELIVQNSISHLDINKFYLSSDFQKQYKEFIFELFIKKLRSKN